MSPLNFLRLSVLASFIFSCASQTNNQIARDEVIFQKGVYKSKSWDETLVFKRSSWFQELNLMYEVMFTKINEETPFFAWFSESEKAMIKSCKTFLLNLKYNYGSQKISHPQFTREMESLGFKEFLVPDFNMNLRMHPDMEKFNLHKHKVAGFCHNQEISEFVLSFPGYPPVNIQL